MEAQNPFYAINQRINESDNLNFAIIYIYHSICQFVKWYLYKSKRRLIIFIKRKILKLKLFKSEVSGTRNLSTRKLRPSRNHIHGFRNWTLHS